MPNEKPTLTPTYSNEHADEVADFNQKQLAKQPLPQDPDTETVTLDTPIVRGDLTISQFTIRKPKTSSLRGLSLAELMKFDVDTLAKVVPRISTPPIVEHELMGMDLSDLVKVSSAVASFFTSPAERAKARQDEQTTEQTAGQKNSDTPTA